MSSRLAEVEVGLLSAPFGLLRYRMPTCFPADTWQIGQRVLVPLQKQLRVGLVLHVGSLLPWRKPDEEDSQGAVSKAEDGFVLKELIWPLDTGGLLAAQYLELARHLALRHAVSKEKILSRMIPAGLRRVRGKVRFFDDNRIVDLAVKELGSLSDSQKNSLAHLWVQGKALLLQGGVSALDREFCLLCSNPPWPVKPGAKKQLELLEFLLEGGLVTRRSVQRRFGKKGLATLRLLVDRSLVRLCAQGDAALEVGSGLIPSPFLDPSEALEVPSCQHLGISAPAILPRHFTLSASQQGVCTPLLQALSKAKAETRLLFGVTGSGKTAVYLELARQCLLSGRSVLLLAPELALALKLWREAAQALSEAESYLFHGYLSPATKEKLFYLLARNERPCLIVGTRSALFLPVSNIGLIVLDEEHDASFKQDEGFIYQAKEIAWFRALQDNALLILGSATPDVKTYYAAEQGRIQVHHMAERVSGGELPEVLLIKIPKDKVGVDLLAEESKLALRTVVERGEQALIVLNRRGYAPQMYCLHCGTVAKCPFCDISLAYHKGRERLLCHYCGYAAPFPSLCAQCQGLHFLPLGEGTEKIEETLEAILPQGSGVLRLDRDSTRRHGSTEEILSRFGQQKASVLVGTQMLSKGHHFPNVTLAIVADADLGLNLPDYRSSERTFQLLVQSSGRAGRGAHPGRVLIQTRDPGHYCWEFVRHADYQGFYAHEIALRQKRRYPPFVCLALIRFTYPMKQALGSDEIKQCGMLLRGLGKKFGVQVLGPVQAPLGCLHGRIRFQCLLKALDWQSVRRLFSAMISTARTKHLRISLDLDPLSLL